MKFKFLRIISIILSISTSLILLISLYSYGFYQELLVSFLPYLVLFSLIVFFSLLFILFLYRRSFTNKTIILSSVAVFLLSISIISGSFRIFEFSYSVPVIERNITSKEISGTYKVLFFNKLYKNNNYSEIKFRIDEINPDIFAFSEVNKDQFDKLDNLFPDYIYKSRSNCNNCKPHDVQIAVWSKYKILNTNQITYKDGLAIQSEIEIDGKVTEFYAIHPAAPVDKDSYIQRNLFINDLKEIINKNKKNRLIIMGDFNTTPWSNYYVDLLRNTNGIYNASQGSGINYTWGGRLIKVHIDHILLSDNIKVENFQVDKKSGSDHNMIWSTISFLKS